MFNWCDSWETLCEVEEFVILLNFSSSLQGFWCCLVWSVLNGPQDQSSLKFNICEIVSENTWIAAIGVNKRHKTRTSSRYPKAIRGRNSSCCVCSAHRSVDNSCVFVKKVSVKQNSSGILSLACPWKSGPNSCHYRIDSKKPHSLSKWLFTGLITYKRIFSNSSL